MTEWQPIETAPKDGTIIDLWVEYSFGGGRRQPDVCWDSELMSWIDAVASEIECQNEFGAARATHWMPLPEPPIQETP